MFTGLIQSIGKVRRQGDHLKIEVVGPFPLVKLGDSVAVDGVCLTVMDVISNGFLADISEETLRRTTLGSKSGKGEFVNLEPALRASDRLGGHLVSGHIDGIGEVISIKELRNSWDLEVRWKDAFYGRYICEKGSICVDGISLTVSKCIRNGERFFIAVIPHTWVSTSLKYLTENSMVNLEADLMAKYAESILDKSKSGVLNPLVNNISKSWLNEHGWN
tara:strand:+ start:291 stop:947 length:657 start_codon:yes stop_codon:yes gene_type:complete